MAAREQQRRVYISGLNPEGRASVVSERAFGPFTPIPGLPSVAYEDLYTVLSAPPDLSADGSRVPEAPFLPAAGGHVVRLLEFQPDPEGHDIESGGHVTDSLDYVVVLEGEIGCRFEGSEVVLNAGDVLVQGGVTHAWFNRSSRPCLVLAVILDATPRAVATSS